MHFKHVNTTVLNLNDQTALLTSKKQHWRSLGTLCTFQNTGYYIQHAYINGWIQHIC